MSNRISQLPVEVLVLPDTPVSLRLSQLSVEVLVLPDTPVSLRLSQLAVEVLVLPTLAVASGTIVTTVVVHLPVVVLADPLQLVTTGNRASAASLFGPAVGRTVTAGTILSGVQLFPPKVGLQQTVILGTIPPGAQVFAPPVLEAIEPTFQDLFANYLTFTQQATTGVQTISGVGFQGKALLLWSTRMVAHGTGTAAQQVVAMSDGLTSSCRFIIHPGGETGTTSGQSERIDSLVFMTTASSSPTVQVQGLFGSWTPDGFTINWTINDGVPNLYHVLVIGGDEIYVAVRQVKITVGLNQTLPVTDVGFQPDSFIVMGGAADEHGAGGSYATGTPFGSIHGYGFSNAAEDICSWTLGRGTGGASDTYAGLHTNRVASVRTANLSGASELCGLTIVGTSPTGFTLKRHDGNSHQPIQHILCIKGALFKLGTFDAPPSPGGLSIPLTFKAGLILVQTHASTTLNTQINALSLMIGTCVMGVSQGGTWIGGTDNASPSVYQRSSFTDRLIEVRNPTTLAVTCEAAVLDSTPTGITMDFSVTSPMTFIYLALSGVRAFDECGVVTVVEASDPGLVWIEFEDFDGNVHVWSEMAIADPADYFFGFKRSDLLQSGAIQRGLSDDTGSHESMAFEFTLADTARRLRGLFGKTG